MSTGAPETFFSNGMQYYIAGRYAIFAGLAPVAGNVLHHAIEMFLKGCLSKTKSLDELKKLRHNLPKIWGMFKIQFKDVALDDFNGIVSSLNSFEELRYPDSVLETGMLCTMGPKRPFTSVVPKVIDVTVPLYALYLEDIDKLVATIFSVASMNPKFFTGMLNGTATQWLNEENAESALTTG